MRRTAGTGRSLRRALGIGACALFLTTMTGCSQAEPDEQKVAEVVGQLPGVTSVNASFAGWSFGNSGDHTIEVEVASPPDATLVEDLVRSLPKAVREVEHGDGYDVFVIATEPTGEGVASERSSSSLTYGPELTPPGLAARWVDAVASTPTEGLRVRVWPSPRRATASISTHDPVSDSLAWALGTDLTDLDWSLAEYLTTGTPYVRFAPGQPLTASMVTDWKAIEATYAGGTGAASLAQVVVVEDVEGVRKVRVEVSFPTVSGPLSESVHGAVVWPIITAINASMPAGHRLELELGRSERSEQGGAAGDGDLVDGGTGSPDWEAAYRQRFPDAVPVSATPT